MRVHMLQSPEEQAEGARPPEDRAQEVFEQLLRSIAGKPVAVPHVRIDRGRAMNPSHTAPIDPSNPPMIGEIRLVMQGPPKEPNKSIDNTLAVFDLFQQKVFAAMELFKQGKGAFLQPMQQAKAARLTAELMAHKKGVGYKAVKKAEHVLPPDAR